MFPAKQAGQKNMSRDCRQLQQATTIPSYIFITRRRLDTISMHRLLIRSQPVQTGEPRCNDNNDETSTLPQKHGHYY